MPEFPSSVRAMFDMIVVSLAIGFSILLLLSHKIGNRNRFATFLLAMIIMVLVCIAGFISFGSLPSQEGIFLAIILMLLTTVMLLAFVLAGFKCRKKYSPVRFMLWLAIWMIGGMAASILIFYTVALTVAGIMGQGLPMSILKLLVQVTIAGLVIGGSLYAGMLPFMIFVFSNGFFRTRFYACLHLKSMPTTADDAELFAQAGEFENPDETNLT